MSVHLIKLCVGVAKVETLERRVAKGDWLNVNTRNTPKRAAELEDGGSLYWVIKGSIVCRMPIADISTKGEGKQSRCLIRLSPEVIRTAPLGHRPFQGWRYLEPGNAPQDLSRAEATDLPDELVSKLRSIGAW